MRRLLVQILYLDNLFINDKNRIQAEFFPLRIHQHIVLAHWIDLVPASFLFLPPQVLYVLRQNPARQRECPINKVNQVIIYLRRLDGKDLNSSTSPTFVNNLVRIKPY